MLEIDKIDRMTPFEAGQILRANAESIRAGLKANRFPFGTAIPPKKKGGKWNYIIIKSKLLEYAGKEEGR